MNKLKLGKFGEEIAANYLTKKGYQILAKNFSTRFGEIDLVCQKDEVIHFIEVKTRTNRSFGWPEEAVTDEKLEKITSAAEEFLAENQLAFDWQVDIISISLNQKTKTAKINHFENITADPAEARRG